MDQTIHLSLPYIQHNQAQKLVTVDQVLARLVVSVHTRAVSASVATQPAEPEEGDTYILPSGAAGSDWVGQAEGTIANFQDGVSIEEACAFALLGGVVGQYQ